MRLNGVAECLLAALRVQLLASMDRQMTCKRTAVAVQRGQSGHGLPTSLSMGHGPSPSRQWILQGLTGTGQFVVHILLNGTCPLPQHWTICSTYITHVMGFISANYQLATMFHSPFRVRHGTDRRTDRQQPPVHNATTLWGRRIVSHRCQPHQQTK